MRYANGLVLGLEADVTFRSPLHRPGLAGRLRYHVQFFRHPARPCRPCARRRAALRDGGRCLGPDHVNIDDADGEPIAAKSLSHIGWTAGVGIEHALTGNWTAKYEYSYVDLGSQRTACTCRAMIR